MKLKIPIYLITTLLTINVYGQDQLPVCVIDSVIVISTTNIDDSFTLIKVRDWQDLLYQNPRFTINRTGEKREKIVITPYMRSSSEWKRYKTFKTLGWTSLTVGVLSVGGGLGWSISMNEKAHPKIREKAAEGIFYSGIFLIGASIPLFIISGVYKGHALSVGGGNVISPSLNGNLYSQPALAVRASF